MGRAKDGPTHFRHSERHFSSPQYPVVAGISILLAFGTTTDTPSALLVAVHRILQCSHVFPISALGDTDLAHGQSSGPPARVSRRSVAGYDLLSHQSGTRMSSRIRYSSA